MGFGAGKAGETVTSLSVEVSNSVLERLNFAGGVQVGWSIVLSPH